MIWYDSVSGKCASIYTGKLKILLGTSRCPTRVLIDVRLAAIRLPTAHKTAFRLESMKKTQGSCKVDSLDAKERSRYVSLRLMPGEMICTDNWRVMHSRSGFIGSRHWKGESFPIIEFLIDRMTQECQMTSNDYFRAHQLADGYANVATLMFSKALCGWLFGLGRCSGSLANLIQSLPKPMEDA